MRTEEIQGLITGNSYQDDVLQLEVRGKEKKYSVPLTIGDKINFAFDAKRKCIGYRKAEGSSGSLLSCPNNVTGITSAQCPDCLGSAKILPCLRCTGEVCRNQVKRNFCVQPENHALYLAGFASGIIKVGVSRWPRRQQRLLEQGARCAIIVARDDGQMIRRYETQITSFGFVDRLSSSEKLTYLSQNIAVDKLLEEIHEAYEKIRLRMRAPWLDELETIHLPEYPSIHGLESASLWKPKDNPGRAVLKGEILHISGRLMILKDSQSDQPLVIDLKDAVGYEVSPALPEEQSSGQMQLSLFG